MSFPHSLPRIGLAAATVVLTAAATLAQQFAPGSVYLYSGGLPQPPNQLYSGMVRVDASTGAVTPFWTAPTGLSVTTGRAAYDPFRDRIVLANLQLSGLPLGVYTLDAAANVALLAASPMLTIAPRGDGLLYGSRGTGAPNFWQEIDYLDAANTLHTLLDVGGSQPWRLLGGAAVFGSGVRTMIYEPRENALFLVLSGDYQSPNCAGVTGGDITIHKLPLLANGAALRAPSTCTTFSVSSIANSAEYPLQWSYGPFGDLALSVQTTWSGAQPRFVRVDPGSGAASAFVTTGPYLGDQGIQCGVYCPLQGRFLLWDGNNDEFRSFAPLSSGAGTVLGSYGSPGLGAGQSQMLVVGPIGPQATLSADVYSVSTSLGGVQQLTFSPGPSQAGNQYLIAGTLSGWWPGLPLGPGLVMPINYDAFTSLTVQLANSPLLVNTAGVFGPSGSIQASVVVPPGVLSPLSGFTLHFAGVAATPASMFTMVSNPVPLVLTP